MDLRSFFAELISEFRRWKLFVSFKLISLNSISLSFFNNFPEVSIFVMFTKNSDTLIGSLSLWREKWRFFALKIHLVGSVRLNFVIPSDRYRSDWYFGQVALIFVLFPVKRYASVLDLEFCYVYQRWWCCIGVKCTVYLLIYFFYIRQWLHFRAILESWIFVKLSWIWNTEYLIYATVSLCIVIGISNKNKAVFSRSFLLHSTRDND